MADLASVVSLLASVAVVVLMAYDKLASKAHVFRIPERWLLWLTAAGGFFGTAIGMLLLRHKVRKTRFWAVVCGAAVLWAAVVPVTVARVLGVLGRAVGLPASPLKFACVVVAVYVHLHFGRGVWLLGSLSLLVLILAS